MNSLFRKQALEATTTKHLGVVIVASPKSLSVASYAMVVLIALLIAVLIFTSYTRRVSVEGRVQPAGGAINIYATNSGIVEDINKYSEFKKNDLIIKVKTERTGNGVSTRDFDQTVTNRIDSLDRNTLLNSDQIENQIRDLKYSILSQEKIIKQNQSVLEQQKSRLAISHQIQKKYIQLNNEKFISDLGLAEKKQTLIDQEAAVTTMESRISELVAELQSKKNKLEEFRILGEKQKEENIRLIEQTKSELIQNKFNNQNEIRAPEDAYLAEFFISKGQMLTPGQLLLNLVPRKSSPEIIIFIPSDSIGFIREGSLVNIKYDAFPYQKFGIHQGKIKNISKNSFTAEELKSGLKPGVYYKAIVSMPSKSIKTYGKNTLIPLGSSLKADIAIETRRVFEWILEPLYTIKGTI